MHHVDPQFLSLLGEYDLSKLEHYTGSAYGLWPDWRIAYLNPAWFCFAAQNGGEARIDTQWALGANLMKAVPPALLEFYQQAYTDCLQQHRTWGHDYECSSPDQYRLFHQVVYPLGRKAGLLIVNSLVVEHPHDPHTQPASPAEPSAYIDENGFLHQCSHCRRTKRQRTREPWDWVPAWVARSPVNTSHTLCETCLGYYMSQLPRSARG